MTTAEFRGFLERWGPSATTVIGTVGTYVWLPKTAYTSILSQLMPSAINVSAITIGFLATAKAILISIDDRGIVEYMRDGGVYTTLLGYMMNAIKASFLVAILSSIGVVLGDQAQAGWMKWFICLWAAASLFAGSSSYRVIHLVGRVIRASAERNR